MRTILLALGLSALTFAPLAQANERTIHIPVSDADLASQTSLEALYERVERAAARVCRSDMPSPIELRAGSRACRAETVAAAITDANIPALSAYHAAQKAPVVSETATLAAR